MMVTASIVLYKNSIAEISKTINYVLATKEIQKLFLIDNSPTNILESKLQHFIELQKVEYIYNNSNVGFGAGHNVALKQALITSTYHLILNPDISFQANVIGTLINYLQINIQVGLVMPKVLYPDGSIQYLCKLLPTPFDLIFRRFLPINLFKKQRENFELRFTSYNKTMEVPYLSGCFMFLRIDALKKVGLFDERFFMYPEDIDLSRRIHRYYKTVFFPGVSIIHEHGQGSYKNFKMLTIHTVNMIKYFNKWGWFIDVERKQVNKKIFTQLNKK